MTQRTERILIANINRHVMAQGEVVFAANALHDAYFRIFLTVLGLDRRGQYEWGFNFLDHASSIWHVIQNDGTQREMAFNALATLPTELNIRPAIPRLGWAKKATDELSRYRNLIAHVPIQVGYVEKNNKLVQRPSFSGTGMRAVHRKRLFLMKGLRLWRSIYNDLLDLQAYVEGINQNLRRLESERHGVQYSLRPFAWPRRPRLRSLTRLREIERKIGREAQKPKRQRRRRSSRA